ncbi:hypothetical protein [Mycolicibacterium bacteremicum]|uniref:hypothetical protein n=1 Tax=Mycolicibacterium bacteremicum TaxID=564198 RepID=UPI0026ED9E0A|nr:hypothetical protein [Mycolicibacterium bacteremicum]
MAAYRMTPARRAALEKAQAASARKRRKLGTKSRTSALRSRKTLAAVAVGGFVAHNVVKNKVEERQFENDPINEAIVNRHVEVARYHNWRLNQLRALGIPPQLARAFDEEIARREALEILKRRKKKS